MAFLPENEIPELLPHVVSWITALESQARVAGRSLNGMESDLARKVGVSHPEDVRILSVEQIPVPPHVRVNQLAQSIGLLSPQTGGITAMHGVFIRSDCIRNARLLTHEFAHVEQYERLGIEGFLREYIQQLTEYGYKNSPFELEAEDKAAKACRESGL
jgi:hypothetical protein